MKYFNSNYFTYRNNQLFCEEVPIQKIIKKVGTPAYIYSKKFFIDRYNEFTEAFKNVNHSIFFAIKSNFNLNVIKLFSNLSAGLDVNSAGELHRALKIGINPQKLLFSGVGKTRREIEEALKNNVLMLKAESEEEIYLIDQIAHQLAKVAPLAIRVNPNVDAQTHPYISTGLAKNKFGISSDEALRIYKDAAKLKNVRPVGIDMHIGSQITSIEPYKEAVQKMADLFFEIKANGIELEHFDIGGGMGVTYNDEIPFKPKELAEAILPTLKKLNCEIMFEPGRFLSANGGILATEILYTKKNGDKNFLVVDASMTDILRPSIYGAYHHIQPIEKNGTDDIIADVVGPVCESGDFVAKDREIVKCKSGEFLAIMSAGAYSMVMSSNYNGRRRGPEIIVDKDKFFITRSRETFEHLLYDEKIINELF
ncbi:MAG: diaminopimelate decarboxylase [Ignavibacteriales bacterium]|nr:diaminopimelate decarboxylase [Ignavibacteriales bacterium]